MFALIRFTFQLTSWRPRIRWSSCCCRFVSLDCFWLLGSLGQLGKLWLLNWDRAGGIWSEELPLLCFSGITEVQWLRSIERACRGRRVPSLGCWKKGESIRGANCDCHRRCTFLDDGGATIRLVKFWCSPGTDLWGPLDCWPHDESRKAGDLRWWLTHLPQLESRIGFVDSALRFAVLWSPENEYCLRSDVHYV